MMFVMRTFFRLGLLLGGVLLRPGFLWAQNSIVIWFEKEDQFEKFQKPDTIETIEKQFVWIESELEVKLMKHSEAKRKLKRENMSLDKLKEKFKPTYLLVIRPLYTSEKILSGEIKLYKSGNAPIDSVFFGGRGLDLSQVVSKKINVMIAKLNLPSKCRILGKPCNTVAHWGQAIMVGGTIAWMLLADGDELPTLPPPKPLPKLP